MYKRLLGKNSATFRFGPKHGNTFKHKVIRGDVLWRTFRVSLVGLAKH